MRGFSPVELGKVAHIYARRRSQTKCNNRIPIPTNAPPKTNHAEFTRNFITKTIATVAITIGVALNIVSRANCHPTNAINATAAAFTPSKNVPAIGDFRNFGKYFAVTATKKNAGKNIPAVASTAPFHPAITYPTNVATVKNGPGVP